MKQEKQWSCSRRCLNFIIEICNLYDGLLEEKRNAKRENQMYYNRSGCCSLFNIVELKKGRRKISLKLDTFSENC